MFEKQLKQRLTYSNNRHSSFHIVCFIILCLLTLGSTVQAADPITFEYFYDDTGQLIKVKDSTNTVVEYIYDAVGNMQEIKRYKAIGLTLLNFTPQQGTSGLAVNIQGQGFSSLNSENKVSFNGINAIVVFATDSQLKVLVPAGATTGLLSVTVATETVQSNQPFTVIQAPVIQSISTQVGVAGQVISNFTVTGTHLSGANFSFEPELVPSAINVDALSVNANGTSAVMTVAVITEQMGDFVLVGSNQGATSDSTANQNNTFSVIDALADNDFDGLSNTEEGQINTDPFDHDSDDDGINDKEELLAGSDPLDNNSVPDALLNQTLVIGQQFSIVNDALPTMLEHPVIGPNVSVQNTIVP